MNFNYKYVVEIIASEIMILADNENLNAGLWSLAFENGNIGLGPDHKFWSKNYQKTHEN